MAVESIKTFLKVGPGPGSGLRNLLEHRLPLFVLTRQDLSLRLVLIVARMDHLDFFGYLTRTFWLAERLKCSRGHLLNVFLTDFSPLVLMYLELTIGNF